MGKSSQRKGRSGEHEVVRVLTTNRVPARVNGIWEPLDMNMEIDGFREDFEVKRKRDGMSWAYGAIDNDAKGCHFRADRRQWLTIVETEHYADLLIRAQAVNPLPSIDIEEPIE
jgi:hypothetical protein